MRARSHKTASQTRTRGEAHVHDNLRDRYLIINNLRHASLASFVANAHKRRVGAGEKQPNVVFSREK
jgi:hypothetical protein